MLVSSSCCYGVVLLRASALQAFEVSRSYARMNQRVNSVVPASDVETIISWELRPIPAQVLGLKAGPDV